MSDLELHTVREGDLAVVGVTGEVDHATAPQLRTELDSAFAGGSARVVVDLSRTEFLDSSGLGVFVGVSKQQLPLGGRLSIACPKQQLRKLFAISHLDEVLEVYPDVASARA